MPWWNTMSMGYDGIFSLCLLQVFHRAWLCAPWELSTYSLTVMTGHDFKHMFCSYLSKRSFHPALTLPWNRSIYPSIGELKLCGNTDTFVITTCCHVENLVTAFPSSKTLCYALIFLMLFLVLFYSLVFHSWGCRDLMMFSAMWCICQSFNRAVFTSPKNREVAHIY